MALKDEHSTLTAEESAYFKEAAAEVAPKEAARVARTQPKPKPQPQPAAVEDAPQAGVDDQGTEEGEGTEDVGAEGQTAQQQRKMVDLAALQESRAEKKASDERARIAEERYNRLEQRTNQLLEAQILREQQAAAAAAAPAAQAAKAPDYTEDPAGYIAHEMQTQGRTLQEVQAELQQRRNADQQRAVVAHVLNHAAAQEQQFAAVTPDYNDASNFLIQARAQELQILGYPQQTIQETINQERLLIADMAMRNGGNPAEMVYKMAAQRGYKKAAPAAAAAVPGAEPVAALDPAAKLAALKEGQEASQSLSQGRGQAPHPLTAARLSEMSDADFDKMMRTPQGRALMGA